MHREHKGIAKLLKPIQIWNHFGIFQLEEASSQKLDVFEEIGYDFVELK